MRAYGLIVAGACLCALAPHPAQAAPPLIERGILLQGMPNVPPWRCRRRQGVRVYWPVAGNGTQLANRLRATDGMRKKGPSPYVEPDRRRRRGIRVGRWRDRRLNNSPFRPITPLELRILGMRPRGRERRELGSWPSEPPSPANVDQERFNRALRRLCPLTASSANVRRYAKAIVETSRSCRNDPFLLGALAYHFSSCDENQASSFGLGLTAINYRMYKRGVRDGFYHYWAYRRGGWQPRTIRLGKYRYTRATLRNAESNIYFAAHLLHMHHDQHASTRSVCGSRPHRHYVSKFIWGDRVRSTSPEDMVLTARRMLLAYYSGHPPPVLKHYAGLELGCPLDGCPRRVTSAIGEKRENGRRKHSGVDVLSRWGEPVRAMADGVVSFAGVDLRQRGQRNWDPALVGLLRRSGQGPRGLYVRIQHRGGLHSEYMHLATFSVRKGQQVRRGALLGYVGRTGIQVSDEHLHLGIFRHGVMLDPIEVFDPHLIAPAPRRARSRKARAKPTL